MCSRKFYLPIGCKYYLQYILSQVLSFKLLCFCVNFYNQKIHDNIFSEKYGTFNIKKYGLSQTTFTLFAPNSVSEKSDLQKGTQVHLSQDGKLHFKLYLQPT